MENNMKNEQKWLKQTKEAREISKKIIDFGVTQFQILKIIESLSLELEDRSIVLAIKDAVRTAIEASEIQMSEKKEIII